MTDEAEVPATQGAPPGAARFLAAAADAQKRLAASRSASLDQLLSQESLVKQYASLIVPTRSLVDRLVADSVRPWHSQLARHLAASRSVSDLVLGHQLKFLDGVTPALARLPELTAASRVADLLAASSTLKTWRASMVSHQRLIDLAGASPPGSMQARLLREAMRSSLASSELASWAVGISASGALGGFSDPAVRALSRYTGSLPTPPSLIAARNSVIASEAIGGLLGSEILTAGLAEDLEAEATERIDANIIAPWEAGHNCARADLLTVLRGLDPTVPELLAGAWDDVSRQGPAAVSKIANCSVEALDRCLRAAAPPHDLLAWIGTTDRQKALLDEKGRPTRAARVRYVLRSRNNDLKLVEAHVESLVTMAASLNSRIQAAKHASTTNVSAVRSYLITVESVLHLLFTVSDA